MGGATASPTPCASSPSCASSSTSWHLVNERILQSQLWCWWCFRRILSLTRRTCSEMGHGLKSQLWFWIILLIAHLFVIRRLWITATIFFGRLRSPVVPIDSFGRIQTIIDYPRGEDNIISRCSNLDFGQSIVLEYICKVSNGSIVWLIIWCAELAHLVMVDSRLYSHVDHYIQHLVCSW
jgi:hypothetical protein